MLLAATIATAILFATGLIVFAWYDWHRQQRAANLPQPTLPEPTEQELLTAVRAMTLLAVEMSRADGEVLETELEQIRKYLVGFVPEATPQFVEECITEAVATPIDAKTIRNAARRVRKHTTRAQRLYLVETVLAVARAGGPLTDPEQRYLVKVARWLGLDDVLDVQRVHLEESFP